GSSGLAQGGCLRQAGASLGSPGALRQSLPSSGARPSLSGAGALARASATRDNLAVSIAVESLTFETPYLRLAAQAWGPADGVPVLAFHGWLDNSASFETLAIELLQRDPQLRLVAWDAPGHGHSQHRRDAGYHFI